MRAQVDQKFRHGFKLTEEGLIKIGDILKSRLVASGGTAVLIAIDVKRADHALITYDNIGDVLKEENGKIDRIKALKIYNQGDGDEFSVEFEKGEKSSLKIISSSRDNALLALSDLREYLKSEVIVQKLGFISSVINHRMAFPTVMLLAMISMFARISIAMKQIEIKPPNNPNIDQKINYLYQIRVESDRILPLDSAFSAIFLWPFSLFVIFWFLLFWFQYIYQNDLFIWGKEKSRIESTRSIMSKVFWTILIGLPVSIISGMLLELR